MRPESRRGQLPRVEFTCPKGKSSGAPSPSILRQTLSLSGEGEMTRESAKERHLSSHRRSGPNLRKGCLALPKGVKCKWQSPEESFGTDSLTSPPAADRARASIYSTALTVTEKTGTGWLFNNR
ncbi:hypothetical protein SESBI_42105 [Sesbania bispinosa]|nr:hypothetical protein SESBI_42105 [Sesbania bispinosa]